MCGAAACLAFWQAHKGDPAATLLVWRRPTADPSAPPEVGHTQQDCLLELPLCLPAAALGTDPMEAAALVQLMLDSRRVATRKPRPEKSGCASNMFFVATL